MPVNIQPLFDKIMKDPDIVPEEGQEKSDIAIAMVLQRAKQAVNNERVLNFVNEPEDFVTKLMDFITIKKEDDTFMTPEAKKHLREELGYTDEAIESIRFKAQYTLKQGKQDKNFTVSDAREFNMAEDDEMIEGFTPSDITTTKVPEQTTKQKKAAIKQLYRPLKLAEAEELQVAYDQQIDSLIQLTGDGQQGTEAYQLGMNTLQALADVVYDRNKSGENIEIATNPDYELPESTSVQAIQDREVALQERQDTKAIKQNPSQLPKFLHKPAVDIAEYDLDKHFTSDQLEELLSGDETDEETTFKREEALEDYIKPMIRQHELNNSKRTGRPKEKRERDDVTLWDRQQWLGTAAKDDDGNIVRDKNGKIDLEHVMERLHGFGVQIAKERDDLEADAHQVGSAKHGKRDWNPTSEHKDDVKRLQNVRKQIGLPPKAKTPSTPTPKAATPKKETSTSTQGYTSERLDKPLAKVGEPSRVRGKKGEVAHTATGTDDNPIHYVLNRHEDGGGSMAMVNALTGAVIDGSVKDFPTGKAGGFEAATKEYNDLLTYDESETKLEGYTPITTIGSKADDPIKWDSGNKYNHDLKNGQIIRDSNDKLYTVDRLSGYNVELMGINEDGSWRSAGHRTINTDPSSPEFDKNTSYFPHKIGEGDTAIDNHRDLVAAKSGTQQRMDVDTPPPTKTSKKKAPTADESQAKGIVDAPVPAKTISDDARQHLKDVAGLSDEQIDTGIEAGDYHTKAGRRRSLTNIKQNFPAPPKEEDKKEDTTTAVAGTEEQPQGTLFDDTDDTQETPDTPTATTDEEEQEEEDDTQETEEKEESTQETENVSEQDKTPEKPTSTVDSSINELMDKHNNVIEHMYEETYGKDNEVTSLEEFKADKAEVFNKMGAKKAKHEIAVGHNKMKTLETAKAEKAKAETDKEEAKVKREEEKQATAETKKQAVEEAAEANQKSKDNADADKAANDIGKLTKDPKEWDKQSATERYRDVMHHIAGHAENRLTDKTKEALIGAAQRAVNSKKADTESVDKIMEEHTKGDTSEAQQQKWDKYKKSDQYQKDIDTHKMSLKRDGDHDDLLSGQAGREARGEAFKNNDSNRLIHSDENGNASHSELMHPNFKDGRKKVKESDETKGASSHINDHEEVHGGSGRGEDGERILDKHSPDWNKDETAPQSSILSDTEKEQQRIDRGQPPGPPPKAGQVWAAGIHHWVNPDKLSELQSGSQGGGSALGEGEAHYIPPHQVGALLGGDGADFTKPHADGTTGHQGGVFVTQHGLHRATDHTGTPDSLAHHLGADASHGSAPDLASASLGHAANKLGLSELGADGKVEHKDYHPDTHKLDKTTMDSTGINDQAKAPAPTGSSQYMDSVKDSETPDSNLGTALGRFKSIRNKLQTARKKVGGAISGAAGQAYADFMGDTIHQTPGEVIRRAGKTYRSGMTLAAKQAIQRDEEGAWTKARARKAIKRQGVKERIAFGQGGMKDSLQRSSKTSTEVEKFMDWQYK